MVRPAEPATIRVVPRWNVFCATPIHRNRASATQKLNRQTPARAIEGFSLITVPRWIASNRSKSPAMVSVTPRARPLTIRARNVDSFQLLMGARVVTATSLATEA